MTILHEMNHSTRIIPTDGHCMPLTPKEIRLWRGDSRGHWEGDTLVVDVTNFNADNPFHGSGDKLHVVERASRGDVDADTGPISVYGGRSGDVGSVLDGRNRRG